MIRKMVSVALACCLVLGVVGCGKPAAEVAIDNSKMTEEQKQQVEQQGQALRGMVVPPAATEQRAKPDRAMIPSDRTG